MSRVGKVPVSAGQGSSGVDVGAHAHAGDVAVKAVLTMTRDLPPGRRRSVQTRILRIFAAEPIHTATTRARRAREVVAETRTPATVESVPINGTVSSQNRRKTIVPHISDILDAALLEQMLEARYVKRQPHPTLPLHILNYTQSTQFDRLWNDVTRACRGLIVDGDGNVIARPYNKFFNLGEHDEGSIPAGAVHVTDKLDGSLGILYPNGTGYALSTRGSFTSEQAVHATALYERNYAASFTPTTGWTYLFEIIYPGNRIVVDYQGLDDLILLGAVDTATGRSVPLSMVAPTWPGPVVEELPYTTLQDALTAPARIGKEGVVVHFLDADLRIKVKHEEYVRLHRIVTGVSERRIWEALSEGQDLSAWLDAVPDEFYSFVDSTRSRLIGEFSDLETELRHRYERVVTSLPDGWTRKEFAAVVTASDWPLSRALFNLLDGRDHSRLIWQQLRPVEHVPLFSRNEDNN